MGCDTADSAGSNAPLRKRASARAARRMLLAGEYERATSRWRASAALSRTIVAPADVGGDEPHPRGDERGVELDRAPQEGPRARLVAHRVFARLHERADRLHVPHA